MGTYEDAYRAEHGLDEEPGVCDDPGGGPPMGWYSGRVPVDLLLGRSQQASVLISQIMAFKTGFTFRIKVLYASLRFGDLIRGLPFENWRLNAEGRSIEPGSKADPNLLRYGIEFADGRGANRHDGIERRFAGTDPRKHLILLNLGGRGDGQDISEDCWVWPLPPPGEVKFTCEWPARGIAPQDASLDAALILGGASRARPSLAE